MPESRKISALDPGICRDDELIQPSFVISPCPSVASVVKENEHQAKANIEPGRVGIAHPAEYW